MMLRTLGVLTVIIVAAGCPKSVLGDTLKLKDGRVFYGRHESTRDGAVWFNHVKMGLPKAWVYLAEDVEQLIIDPATVPPEVSSAAPPVAEPTVPSATASGGNEPTSPSTGKPSTEPPERPAAGPPTGFVRRSEFDAPRVQDPVLDGAKREDAVRDQWRSLAVYLSMKNELCLEDVTPESLAQTAGHILDVLTKPMDAHPDLESVGPPYLRYLAESATRIIPVFRARLDQAESLEGALFSALIELASRQHEAAVLAAWQEERDSASRAAYARLLPLVRSMAPPIDTGADPPLVTSSGGGLLVTNATGRALSDVTLVLHLRTFDDRTSMHYFFIPDWPSGGQFVPRAAADWASVGLAGTTEGTLQMFSNELATPPSEFELPENAMFAVTGSLARLAETSPKRAMKGLLVAKVRFGFNQNLSAAVHRVHERARLNRLNMMDGIKKRLAHLDRLHNDARGSAKEPLRRQIAELEKRLRELN